MARLKPGDWFILLGAIALIGGGIVCIGQAIGANIESVQNQQAFETSGAALHASQVVAEPTPIWVQSAAPGSPPASVAPAGFDTPVESPQAPLLTPAVAAAIANPPVEQWSNVAPIDTEFKFIDPPEPGAHAQVWVRVSSNGPKPGAFILAIPLTWFDAHRLEATRPSASRTSDVAGERRIFFTDLQPGTWAIALDVVSTAEGVEPPIVRVEQVTDGRLIAESHPHTVAPRPNPGPVSALRISSIDLNAAVVPTSWEPPPFVVGQLKDSAYVTRGNTVLVGHLTGAAGAVFKNLDNLSLGDTIVAVSRGLEYQFVVSDKQTLPADDSEPAASDDRPRLTLMTCTGTWDPLSHNYSDRLWVTAELPGAAAATIAANARRPTNVESTPAAVLAAAGLGAERAQFDAMLGPPLGETPGKLVVYRQGSNEYHVSFTPDPPRAELIEIVPHDSVGGLTIPTAVTRSRAAFPSDAVPQLPGPEELGDIVVERFTSPAAGAVLGTSTRGGDAGDFLAAYVRDALGKVTRVIVAAGDDQIAARRDAER